MARRGQSSLPKQSFPLKQNDDIANHVRSLIERFNNRLALDNLRLSERYLNDEVHILINFRFRNDVEGVACFQRERNFPSLISKSSGIPGGVDIFEQLVEAITDPRQSATGTSSYTDSTTQLEAAICACQ